MICVWGLLREHRDRFVVTNMRVFRVHGVLTTHLATMPLSRILDISVVKPVQGRSAGVRALRLRSPRRRSRACVTSGTSRDPTSATLTIQRVVQRSGLRGPRVG